MMFTKAKPVSVFTHEQLAKYEFCRMDGSDRAMRGALGMMCIPAVMVMVVMTCGMHAGSKEHAIADMQQSKPVSKQVRARSGRVYASDEPLNDQRAYAPVINCGWEKC